jgi:hypothetical protein
MQRQLHIAQSLNVIHLLRNAKQVFLKWGSVNPRGSTSPKGFAVLNAEAPIVNFSLFSL